MEYGLIGWPLGHSRSAEVHRLLGNPAYQLREIKPEELESFLRARNFRGLNVTIPYKERVIPLLDEVDRDALAIGAVNTVVHDGGRLIGYNTDIHGMLRLLRRMAGGDASALRGKTLVLGTGGTARTARYALARCGAERVITVSRTGKDGSVTYEEAAAEHGDAAWLVNTTPCGMFPHTTEQPVPLAAFPALHGLAEVIYNPPVTRLMAEARRRGIRACGGLEMLVEQAARADTLFRGTVHEPADTERVMRQMTEGEEDHG